MKIRYIGKYPNNKRFKKDAINIKPVFTYSPVEKKVRLFRIIWDQQSKYFSVGLQPKLYDKTSTFRRTKVWILGMVFHYKNRAGGGLFV